MVAAAVAVIAGAQPLVALRLGVAMLALQAGIGSANDLIDAPSDAVAKPSKPIPAGLVDERTAEIVMMAALAVGLALAALSGLTVLGVGVLGTAIGLVYDIRLKGTPWSWLPFALGVPLLPLFGWLGSGAPLPPALLLAVALAVPAGAALAVANAIADVEADTASGRASIATALGPERAWTCGAALQTAVVAASVVALLASGWPRAGDTDVAARVGLVASGLIASAAVVGLGLVLGRSRDASLAGRGWELQAVGLGCLAVVWLLAIPLRG